MSEPQARRTDQLDAAHRDTMRWAFVASILCHILILLFFVSYRPIPPSPFSAAGPRTGSDRAAAGGGGMQVVAIRTADVAVESVETEVVEPVPEPEPTPDVVERDVPEPQSMTLAMSSAEAIGTAGSSRGDRPGPGIEAGTGTGDGGTADEGLFRVVAPTPRGLILPPSDRPNRVRGREIGVWVFVTAQGRVVSDSTRLEPGTGDSRFDSRLRDQAAQWRFEPARRGGQAVAEWFRYVLIL
jgi:periplasmic protein TonB